MSPGPAITSPWFAIALWVGVGALLLASRVGLRWSGSTLAGLAGLGYAGSAIAVRGAQFPLDVTSVAAALSVAAYGLVAFWLYSVALDRVPVSAASAPLIVIQTFVPALVGVLCSATGCAKAGGRRSSAGLLLATIGAVVLSGDSITSPVTEAPDPTPDQAS